VADFLLSLTDQARQIEAQQLLYGIGIRVDFFEVGDGGHDPGNPTVALPLDLGVTALPGSFFGPEPLDKAELLTPTCPRWTAILQEGEAVGGLSDLGLFATVLSVPGATFIVEPADVDDGTDIFTFLNHGLIDGTSVALTNSGGALPDPLLSGTTYFIVSATANTFQLATTLAGSPIDLLDTGVGIHVFTYGSVSGVPLAGSTFLYAITHFPLRTKLSSSVETFTITIKT